MVRAVFFDAAGTLVEPKEAVGLSYARLAAKFGLGADSRAVAAGFRRAFESAPGLAFGAGRSAAELRRLERRWWRDLVVRSFAGLGEFADFDAFFDALFAFFADPVNWKKDPEAPLVLTRLKERGVLLGVISNFDYRLYGILEGLELRAYFDSITISSEAGFAKPSPELFRVALGKLSVEAGESIHVGDSERLDMEGAAAAGIAAVLIDRGYEGSLAIGERWARAGSLAPVVEVAQRLLKAPNSATKIAAPLTVLQGLSLSRLARSRGLPRG